ncbi:LuxR C-terminal-related transcriptional regulator, partial [uncultured Dysgonomonas sp.]|uniref:helix-turn-helix transcriptional regulator n=1 Tax=uncultured Dysgonomonas sp. TaxID=206096 RepID=UPI000A4A6FE2
SFQQCIEIDSSYTLLQKGNQAKIYLNYANFLALWQYPANRIFPLAKKAIEISKKYNILNIYRNTYGLIAMVLAQQNKYAEAEKSLLEGLNYMKTIPYTDINSQIQFYEFLKDVSAKEKDYEKYYRYDKEYQEIKKNQDIDNERQFMNKAIAKYELQNKDEAIGVLSQKNELKTILLLASILIVVLLAVVFLQNIRSHKTGRKLLESHNREIIKEKEQVQKELVSSVLHLEKKNEILYSLKNQLLQQNKERNATINASVFQSIDEGILIDDDFNRFKDNFNPIYPNFFNQLQEKANHHLTQLDLKYCAFILMKLSNKEIASQMNVEPKSIRMARYRIKQKLNLNKEEDLDTYIESLSKT